MYINMKPACLHGIGGSFADLQHGDLESCKTSSTKSVTDNI